MKVFASRAAAVFLGATACLSLPSEVLAQDTWKECPEALLGTCPEVASAKEAKAAFRNVLDTELRHLARTNLIAGTPVAEGQKHSAAVPCPGHDESSAPVPDGMKFAEDDLCHQEIHGFNAAIKPVMKTLAVETLCSNQRNQLMVGDCY
eukprot:g19245.t1